MNDNSIKSVVILGGGTAGWLSALYLDKFLNHAKSSAEGRVKISLIESSNINTVGVGESTVPTLRKTMAYLGLEEEEWMTKCNATFKSGIKFVNWTKLGKNKENFYWHPFEKPPIINGTSLAHYWLKGKLTGSSESLAHACTVIPTLSEMGRSPKSLHGSPSATAHNYAYHVDSALLAKYLADVSLQRKVTHITDDVTDVVLDNRGYVGHLRTANHGEIFGDLFVDCSGFQGLIIKKALKESSSSFSDSLLCDSAIAMQIPDSIDNYRINPFTTATALGSGWTWNVPLVGRQGVGYVYSSAFSSPDSAEEEFRQHLGKSSYKISAKRIKFEVGSLDNYWVNNCVAVGLSSGFIEPLEATGIYLIELALKLLTENFPDKMFEPLVAEKYNRLINGIYQDIKEFIVLHYCLSDREDTEFWRENRDHAVIPESLKKNLELWRTSLPSRDDISSKSVFFDETSYLYILSGMRYLPDSGMPSLKYLDDSAGDAAFLKIRNQARLSAMICSDHYKYHALKKPDSTQVTKVNIAQIELALKSLKQASHEYYLKIGRDLLKYLNSESEDASSFLSYSNHPFLESLAKSQEIDLGLDEMLLAINAAIHGR